MFARARRIHVLLLTAATLLIASAAPAYADGAPTPVPQPTGPVCGDEMPVKADGTPWLCTFDDEFDGTSLDRKKWTPTTTTATGISGSGACFINDPDNISESNGTLKLTVQKESAPFLCKTSKGNFTTSYSGGWVTSTFDQMYGRFSIDAKFPAATVAGLQSSLWMWPSKVFTSGKVGEIDIAEEYSRYADRAIPYLHYLLDPKTVNLKTNTNIFTNNYCTLNVSTFHEYTVEWTPTTFTISFDGNTCLVDNMVTLGPSPFDQPFMLALTQSLGAAGNYYVDGTTPLPATTEVDWVRVWK